MRKLTTIKKTLTTLAILLTGAITLTTAVASAIPYDGPNTPNSPVPAFNVYTGVPSVGTESDFLRARVPTAPSGDTATPYVDPLNATCVAGQRIQMRVYVHNGASVAGNQNGSGPSVAHGTKVKVTVPGNEATSFSPNATISSTNAAAVTDAVSIRCSNTSNVKLSYVPGSASQYSIGSGVVALGDEIVSSGSPIRSRTVPGDVWGCWDDRVYVILTVQVEQKTTPPPPVTPPSVTPPTPTPPAPTPPATPPKVPDVPVPPSLPNTGAGAVIATFFGVSSLGSGAYYIVRRKLGL